MPISLHAATVPSQLQMLGAAKGWLAKAQDCHLSENEVAEACLAEDMLPFTYQMKSMVTHSMGAFEAVRAGVFSPDMGESPATFEGMRMKLEEATDYLLALTEEEVEGLRGNDMRFEFKDKVIPFTVDDFLLSFSQPNFYFHATTAYALLRANGVKVGKIDYLGQLRVKQG